MRILTTKWPTAGPLPPTVQVRTVQNWQTDCLHNRSAYDKDDRPTTSLWPFTDYRTWMDLLRRPKSTCFLFFFVVFFSVTDQRGRLNHSIN